MTDTRKETERTWEKLRIYGAAFAPTKFKGRRIAFALNGVREQSKGADTDLRIGLHGSNAVDLKERDGDKYKRIRNRIKD